MFIFPEYGFDNTLYMPILFGLLFLLAGNELFGWPRDGWVVPGYLGMVLSTMPEAAAIIVLEALLTFYLVVFISEFGARLELWGRFFGRERFFLFVLASLFVRYGLEEWFLKQNVTWLRELFFQNELDFRQFHSIGLVLVPLIANSFWKSGPFYGLLRNGFLMGLTLCVVHFILLPYSNYSIELFRLMYEDVAMRFSAGSKAYIVLITTALLAAFSNLKYGWDYNGILMPALLAVAMFYPLKVLASLTEAILTVLMFTSMIKLPIIKKFNWGGGRQVVVIFILGLVIKWVIALNFKPLWPGMRITELFGFGYVLPALLAMKIIQKRKYAVVIGPTIIIIFFGFVINRCWSNILLGYLNNAMSKY